MLQVRKKTTCKLKKTTKNKKNNVLADQYYDFNGWHLDVG
jgi:hypothetical protein